MDVHRADLANATRAIRLLSSELALEDCGFTIAPREPESDGSRVLLRNSERPGMKRDVGGGRGDGH
jgi:hypothetical protein